MYKNKQILPIVTVTFALLVASACNRQEAREANEKAQRTATNIARKAGQAIEVAVPIGGRGDPAAMERERFDEGWRGLEGFRTARQGPRQPEPAKAEINFVQGGTESFEGLDPNAILAAPVVVPRKGDVSGPTVLKTQVYLNRARFSPGVIDGRWGKNTAIALWWYQRERGIEATEAGALDEQTFRSLVAAAGSAPPLVQHTLTEEDVKGPFVTIPDDVYEQEKLDCLCYESKREKLAEQFHTTGEFLERLNPGVDFSALRAGDRIWAPNVRPAAAENQGAIARIVISIKGNSFNAYDANDNIVFHAPTTLGSKYDPSPTETLEVKSVTFDPWFHYQPKLFHEVPDDEPEANLHPGPNSPVGIVWIALSKPHYGIHGTSSPDTIGYASSHGCVRLTNWDAREIGNRVSPGVKVEFRDTRKSQVP